MVRRVQQRIRSVAPSDDDGLPLDEFAMLVGKAPSTVLYWIKVRGLKHRRFDGAYFLSRHDADVMRSGNFRPPFRGTFDERMP